MPYINYMRTNHGPLPPNLWVQLDSASDNNSRYVHGYMALLAASGVFTLARSARLIPKHTHEDIDQRFSTISRHFHHANARTPAEFEAQIRQAFANSGFRVEIRWLWFSYGVTRWLEEHQCAWTRNWQGSETTGIGGMKLLTVRGMMPLVAPGAARTCRSRAAEPVSSPRTSPSS